MKPRTRELPIFNLSMLDVITGAMAAFLIIMVVLMPYYKKESVDYQQMLAELRAQRDALSQQAERAEAEAVAAQQQAEQAQQAARDAQQDAEAQRRRAEGLAEKLSKTFLVLYIRWNTRDDIDLHVIDPRGGEFYFARKTIPGHPGELSEDTVNGPGNEVWEIRDAPPGDYQVHAKLYSVKDPRKPVVVQGRVFHRDGSEAFREVQLNRQGEHQPVAVIRVDARGDVTLH